MLVVLVVVSAGVGVAVAAIDAVGCGGSVISAWAKGDLVLCWGL